MRKIPWIGLLLFLVGSPLGPGALYAADAAKEGEIGNYRKEGIDVVQRRMFRKTGRHEFTLDGGINADNQFMMYESVGFKYTYHFRETFGFEGSYSLMIHQNKPIINDLKNVDCPTGATPNANGKCSVTLNPAPDPMKHIAIASLVWSPIYGKFSLFSKKIYHFDIFMVAGGGLFKMNTQKHFGFNVGVGTKVYLNDWCAIRLDLRNITVREGPPYYHIINNRMMLLGVSFFLPPHPYD
ncbi:MAG: outer membrane beta-barrel domain-containing protein [Pseudomonadota bacterium]